MSVKSKIRYLRVTPRKARLVADMIRGKKVQAALNQLMFCNKYVAKDFIKLLRQAIANAEQKGGYDPDRLVVQKVEVNQGPTMKRFMPRARGMASPILKKMSHIELEIG